MFSFLGYCIIIAAVVFFFVVVVVLTLMFLGTENIIFYLRLCLHYSFLFLQTSVSFSSFPF